MSRRDWRGVAMGRGLRFVVFRGGRGGGPIDEEEKVEVEVDISDTFGRLGKGGMGGMDGAFFVFVFDFPPPPRCRGGRGGGILLGASTVRVDRRCARPKLLALRELLSW